MRFFRGGRKKAVQPTSQSAEQASPIITRRKLNPDLHFVARRSIAENRELLETDAERAEAHRKIKQKKRLHLFLIIVGFTVVAGILLAVALFFAKGGQSGESEGAAAGSSAGISAPVSTIEVVDEAKSGITERMRVYINYAEQDFRELGYSPARAVVPAGAVREVDFYLDGHPGFIKLYIDRGSGVSVEDADRMLRYLAGQGITEYEYIDVRIDGKAYWK